MPVGVFLGAYPSAQFAFPRSYAYQLSLLGQSNDVEQFGDKFIQWIDRSIGYGVTYVLNDFILPWSSNRYTLDHVVYDCWWHAFFDGVHHPQAYTVNFWVRGSPLLNTITLVDPALQTHEAFIALSPSPTGYWTPSP
jgi:hypothetical protein